MKQMDYSFSEEELMNLIEEVEQEGLLQAPTCLEYRILNQARWMKEEQLKQKRKQWKRRNMQFYGGVYMAMAVSLAIIFLAPSTLSFEQNFSSRLSISNEKFVKAISDKSAKVSVCLSEWTNQLFSKEEFEVEEKEEK